MYILSKNNLCYLYLLKVFRSYLKSRKVFWCSEYKMFTAAK
jgi:hypothetical protein